MAQQVNLSVNQIQVLPDSMSNMEKLEILRINDNWLQEIPACSKGWIACMDLQVKNNKIRRIAPEIGEVRGEGKGTEARWSEQCGRW
jgi:Leucine-rich repeat (LRR) protein